MKKYKLIKTYPGSPSLGTLALDIGIRYNYVNEGGCFNFSYDRQAIENNPEFWQLVEEKEYQILSFKGMRPSNNRYLFTLVEGDNFKYGSVGQQYHQLKNLINSLPHIVAINSVKRLSDGEIFTLEDEVQDSLTDHLTNFKVQVINNFIISGDKIICFAESGTSMPLNTIRKAKKVLFTTEDGVDIFETKIACAVAIKSGSESTVDSEDNWNSLSIRPNWPYESFNSKYWKMFSTKEAAEEYVINYKPCLSLLDIEGYLINNHQLVSVKKIIKSRL